MLDAKCLILVQKDLESQKNLPPPALKKAEKGVMGLWMKRIIISLDEADSFAVNRPSHSDFIFKISDFCRLIGCHPTFSSD